MVFLANYNIVSRNEVKGPYIKSNTYSKDKEVEGELFGKRVLVKPNGDVVILSVSLSLNHNYTCIKYIKWYKNNKNITYI